MCLNCNRSNPACLGSLKDFDLHFVQITGQRPTPKKKDMETERDKKNCHPVERQQ